MKTMNIKRLDQFVSLCMVAFFTAYIYLAFNFELLPFERNMSFRPDTTPKGVGVIGLILSLIVLFTTKGASNSDNENWRSHDYASFIFMITAMFVYAFALKPAGFVVATTLFLIVGGLILEERRYIRLCFISLVGAFIIWVVVDKLLGIYLYPVPSFIKI